MLNTEMVLALVTDWTDTSESNKILKILIGNNRFGLALILGDW